MLGGMAMKWRWREKMKAAGKPTDKPNMVTGPVQVCWHKFTRYWDVEHREIPMEAGRLLMTPDQVIKRCDENTIGVVPTLGVTFTGQYEPVGAVAEALDLLQGETGLDIPIHVDGASGGFLAPFCAPELVWGFRLPRVKSINTSGHKVISGFFHTGQTGEIRMSHFGSCGLRTKRASTACMASLVRLTPFS